MFYWPTINNYNQELSIKAASAMEQTFATKTPLSTIILERGLSPFDSDAAGLNLKLDVDQFLVEMKAQEHFIKQKLRIKKSLEKDTRSLNRATALPHGQAANSEDPGN